MLWVVRDSLVEDVRQRWRFPSAKVLDAGKHDAQTLLAELAPGTVNEAEIAESSSAPTNRFRDFQDARG